MYMNAVFSLCSLLMLLFLYKSVPFDVSTVKYKGMNHKTTMLTNEDVEKELISDNINQSDLVNSGKRQEE